METRDKYIATAIVGTAGLLVVGTMMFSMVQLPTALHIPKTPVATKAFAQVSEDIYNPPKEIKTWEVEETIVEAEKQESEESEETSTESIPEPETEIFPGEENEETFVEQEAYCEPDPAQVVVDEPVEQPAVQSEPQTYSNSGDFKSDGVWQDESYRYTWYSSNALYHYQTPEWTLGEDGIYRDSEGYVVVASSDLEQGSVVEDTPFGDAKVYDSGCASGTLDVYVGW